MSFVLTLTLFHVMYSVNHAIVWIKKIKINDSSHFISSFHLIYKKNFGLAPLILLYKT